MPEPNLGPIMQIVPDQDNQPDPVYANSLFMNHTPWDFNMLFVVASTPIQLDEQKRSSDPVDLPSKVVANVKIPVTMIDQIIAILQAQKLKYDQQFPS